MEPKTGQKIVSKGAYVGIQTKRGSLYVSGVCLLLLSFPCAILGTLATLYAMVVFGSIPVWSFTPAFGRLDAIVKEIVTWIMVFMELFTCLFVWWGAYRLGRGGITSIKRATQMNVVPFTRANSALDSLVRASAEPLQAQ